ncbi:MAG: SpoIIE family protein phosphatase [Vicingaceae bacterium]|nr:SpoIIE family protein phosphatase [Vicingaceae bacterium]
MSAIVDTTQNWKTELKKTVKKYHVITCWVAVVFNMLFFVTDYLNLYDYWEEFLTFRTSVSIVCLITVLFYKKLKIPIELVGVIPVLLISIQNAYMWSVMDAEHLQKHTMAYMALFIGSGMFVFYHVYFSILIVVANLIANIVFLHFNSPLTIDEILLNGGLLVASVAVFSILLIRMRYNLTKKEIVSRFALQQSKHEVEEKNKEIVDSINYAKRIQDALIPPTEVMKKILPNSFVIFKPKDIVSGDFYWASTTNTTVQSEKDKENLVLFSAADCTGHGVPGAFMSVIGLKLFNQSVKQSEVNSPAQALDFLNTEVFTTVNLHSDGENVIRDGMDVAFCAINYTSLKLYFAGANNPVYIVRKAAGGTALETDDSSLTYYDVDGENRVLIEIKGDKKPIGSYESEESFTDKEYQLQKDDMIYVFSDGYPDQFGGPKGKKLKYSVFKKLLVENSHSSVETQKDFLDKYFEDWRGKLEQLDDVCVIGVRI